MSARRWRGEWKFAVGKKVRRHAILDKARAPRTIITGRLKGSFRMFKKSLLVTKNMPAGRSRQRNRGGGDARDWDRGDY